jgi:hypothetical protein
MIKSNFAISNFRNDFLHISNFCYKFYFIKIPNILLLYFIFIINIPESFILFISIISYTTQYSCIFINAMMLCQSGKPVLHYLHTLSKFWSAFSYHYHDYYCYLCATADSSIVIGFGLVMLWVVRVGFWLGAYWLVCWLLGWWWIYGRSRFLQIGRGRANNALKFQNK